jgi:uncharacterized protein (TIGR02265 family)
MGSQIQGRYIVQILKSFAESADGRQLAELCQDVGLPSEPWVGERYPIVLFNRLMDEGCKRFWPELTLQEGQYRHGKDSLLIYKSSVAGKVSLALSGKDLKKLAASTPQFYKAMSTTGKVNYVDTGEKSYRLELRGFESPPHYHYGAIAEVTYEKNSNVKVKMNILNLETPEPGVYFTDMDFTMVLP